MIWIEFEDEWKSIVLEWYYILDYSLIHSRSKNGDKTSLVN